MTFRNIACASSGVRIIGSAPDNARNFLVSSLLTISVNQPLILSMIGRGVPIGTITPHHRLRSIGTPDSIAHELNQPLGAILANAETAEMLLEASQIDRDQLKE